MGLRDWPKFCILYYTYKLQIVVYVYWLEGRDRTTPTSRKIHSAMNKRRRETTVQ